MDCLINKNISVFNEKAIALLAHKNICNPLSIYELFLSAISNENKSTISCEQTPKNMYYLNVNLSIFSASKSDKYGKRSKRCFAFSENKWKRRFLGVFKNSFNLKLFVLI